MAHILTPERKVQPLFWAASSIVFLILGVVGFVIWCQADYIKLGAPGLYTPTDFTGLMMFYFFLPTGATFFLVFAHAAMHHHVWALPLRVQIGYGLTLFCGFSGLLSLFIWGQIFTSITTPFISYVGQTIAAVCFVFATMIYMGVKSLDDTKDQVTEKS